MAEPESLKWFESAIANAGGRKAPTSRERTATRRSSAKQEDELTRLRRENAQMSGFVSRLHGLLRLQGIEPEERFEEVCKWLDQIAETRRKAGEHETAG